VPTLPVTVVIPVYNRRSLLERALRTVAEQRLQPERVIVIDDGSDDGSAETAERMGADVVRQANSGVSSARNVGLEFARTPWVALLDSDDEWLPNHLATVYPHVAGRVLVSAAAITTFGRLRGSLRDQPLDLVNPEQLLWPENPVVTSGTLLHRPTALSVGAFNPAETYNEDLDLWIRMLQEGSGLALPTVTTRYAHHEVQLSANRGAMQSGIKDMLTKGRAAEWCTDVTYRRVMVRERWDDVRAVPGHRGLLSRQALHLARPANALALTHLLLLRARGRRLADRWCRASTRMAGTDMPPCGDSTVRRQD
jgi:glycosyltransferase involved in cell wall biosynthesis